MVPPHDKNVIAEVEKIKIEDVKFKGVKKNIELIGDEIDEAYLSEIDKLSLSPVSNKRQAELKIVYTPLHGAGVKLVPAALKRYGFENVFRVNKQDINDPTFPTLHSPNPEEAAALEMALDKARKVDADLVLATDPDADRVGVAIKDLNDNFILLNGNQTAAIITYYLLTLWNKKGKLTGNEFIVKTIVTSELICDIAKKYKVECYDVLTGFKWIAEIIRNNEGKKTFIGGGEESYGFMIGDFVRDKDAVATCVMMAEISAWATNLGKTLFELLIDIYYEFGFYKENLISITKKGKAGAEEIQKMMENFRNNPPKEINKSNVMMIKDYLAGKAKDLVNNTESEIKLPSSNVLQFFTADGTKISMRPSGTEPKIKFYFGVKGILKNKNNYEKLNKQLEEKIENVIKALKLRD
jgi:phosphoglucomutase